MCTHPHRYVPGTCPFLLDGQAFFNVGERLSGSFGRCEVDQYVKPHMMSPGQHKVDLVVAVSRQIGAREDSPAAAGASFSEQVRVPKP